MKALRIAVDMVLYFGFCFLAGTGIMLEFAFEKGAGPQSVLSFGKRRGKPPICGSELR